MPKNSESSDGDGRGATCVACGRPLRDDSRFCVACGKHNYDMGRAVGSSLANHSEEYQRKVRALQGMDSIWPSSFLRWWYWFFR